MWVFAQQQAAVEDDTAAREAEDRFLAALENGEDIETLYRPTDMWIPPGDDPDGWTPASDHDTPPPDDGHTPEAEPRPLPPSAANTAPAASDIDTRSKPLSRSGVPTASRRI